MTEMTINDELTQLNATDARMRVARYVQNLISVIFNLYSLYRMNYNNITLSQ